MSESSLSNITIELTRSIVPIIIILGILGNIINIIVLTRRHLRGYACSMYFVGVSTVNLFYSSIILIYNLLSDGYGINPSNYSNIFCKIICYLLNFCPTLSVYYIVLASIDRYCSSSFNAQIRRLSRINVAKVSTLVVTIILVLIMIGTLIAFDLRDDGFGCTIRPDNLFNQVFLFIDVTLYVIIAPFLLIIFGTLTIYNTNRMGQHRIHISRHRRTEKELARMLIVQVSSYILLTGPFCFMFLMLVIPNSLQSNPDFFIIYVLCKIPFYVTFISPFFLYILSARIYREELIKLIKKCFHMRINVPLNTGFQRNTVLPINSVLTSKQFQRN